MLFSFYRDVLKDITNLSVAKTEVMPGKETNVPDKPGRRVKKSSNSPASACDVECREIKSPPIFMFDLGINREINQRSPLFQELLQVKVKSRFNDLYLCFIYFLLKLVLI